MTSSVIEKPLIILYLKIALENSELFINISNRFTSNNVMSAVVTATTGFSICVCISDHRIFLSASF